MRRIGTRLLLESVRLVFAVLGGYVGAKVLQEPIESTCSPPVGNPPSLAGYTQASVASMEPFWVSSQRSSSALLPNGFGEGGAIAVSPIDTPSPPRAAQRRGQLMANARTKREGTYAATGLSPAFPAIPRRALRARQCPLARREVYSIRFLPFRKPRRASAEREFRGIPHRLSPACKAVKTALANTQPCPMARSGQCASSACTEPNVSSASATWTRRRASASSRPSVQASSMRTLRGHNLLPLRRFGIRGTFRTRSRALSCCDT